MRIEIQQLTVTFTGVSSATASAPTTAGPKGGPEAVARKPLAGAPADGRTAGLEAEALANQKLVEAGRMADLGVGTRGAVRQYAGIGVLRQATGAPSGPDLAWRIKSELTKEYWWGPLKVRAATMSVEELAIHARSLAVDGVRDIPMPALQSLVSQWLFEAGVPRVSGLPPSGAPPSPLGRTLGSAAAFLGSIPTSVTLGNPERLAATADTKGFTLAHEGTALKLSAGIEWDRLFQAKAAYRGLEFSASAKVFEPEKQEVKLGLQYGPDIPDLKEAGEKFTGAGTAFGNAIVNVPNLVGYLQEKGLGPLAGVPDAVEQAKKIAGERDRTLPVTFGIEAKASRDADSPPSFSVTGNLSFRWDLLKKALPGAPPNADDERMPSLPQGDGRPLGSSIQKRMEQFFGRPLPDVRIHTGPGAESAATQLGAEAFTVGRDVYFGAGKYAPDSRDGLGLLGHELTHVLQQDDRRTNGARRAGGGDTDTLEREAEAAAQAIVTSPGPAHGDALVIDDYRRTHRVTDGGALTEAERVMLDQIATRGREVCEQILRAEHSSVLGAGGALPRLRMTFDVDLASVVPDAAAQAWGRRMAETIVAAIGTMTPPATGSPRVGTALLSPDPQGAAPAAAPTAAPAAAAPAAPPGAAPSPATAQPVPAAPAATVPMPKVTDDDRDLIRRVEVRAKVLAKIKERDDLKVKYAALPEVKAGTPPDGISNILPDRLAKLNDEIDQLLGEAGVQTEAQYQAERAKRLLPGPDVPMTVRQQLDLIPSQLADNVGFRATQMAYFLLAQNEAIAKQEKIRYSKGVEGFDPQKQRAGLRDAAWKLHEAKTAMDKAAASLGRVLALVGGLALFGGGKSEGKKDDYFDKLLAEKKEDFQKKHDAFKEIKNEAVLKYPILGGEFIDYLQISRLTPEALDALFTSEIDKILKNIETTRGNIAAEKLRPITLEPVLGPTKDLMGIKANSPSDDAVKARLSAIERQKTIADIAITALTIGSALLAAVPGLGILAGAASLALGVYGAAEALEEHGIKGAAAMTAISKAQSISHDEPSFLWVAIAIVGVLPDAVVAARAFGRLMSLRRAVATNIARDVAKAKGVGESALAAQLRKEGNAMKPGMGDALVEQASKERDLATTPPRSAGDAEPPTLRDPHAGVRDGSPPSAIPETFQEITEDYLTVHHSAQDAYNSYRNARRLDPTREVGIWENSRTKEWVVGYGQKDKVLGPYQISGKTKEVWKLIEHFHPSGQSIDLLARVPSNEDFFNVCKPLDPSKSVFSTLSWKDRVTGKPRTSWFGRDPGEAKPFWVRYADLDEKGNEVLVTLRFENEPWHGKGRIEYELFLDDVKTKQSALIHDAPTNPGIKVDKRK